MALYSQPPLAIDLLRRTVKPYKGHSPYNPSTKSTKKGTVITRNRNTQLNIRLSESEMDKLTRNARRSGLSKSNYIRMLVNGYVPKESPPIEYNHLIRTMTDVYSELKLQHTDEAAKELQTAILQLQAALTLPERRS